MAKFKNRHERNNYKMASIHMEMDELLSWLREEADNGPYGLHRYYTTRKAAQLLDKAMRARVKDFEADKPAEKGE